MLIGVAFLWLAFTLTANELTIIELLLPAFNEVISMATCFLFELTEDLNFLPALAG